MSDLELETSFLELERRTLEQSLRATADEPQPPASNAYSSPADAEQPRIGSWWMVGERHIDSPGPQTEAASAEPEQLKNLLACIVNIRSRGRDPDVRTVLSAASTQILASETKHLLDRPRAWWSSHVSALLPSAATMVTLTTSRSGSSTL